MLNKGRYTKEEEEKLVEMFHENYRHIDIAKELNRSVKSIERKTSRLGLKRGVIGEWTEKETELLIELAEKGLTRTEMVEHFEGRTWTAIHRKITRMKLKVTNEPRISKPYVWTDEDYELKRLAKQGKTRQEAADIISEYYSYVCGKERTLGIKFASSPSTWTGAEIDLLKKCVSDGISYNEIEEEKIINKSKSALRSKGRELGLSTYIRCKDCGELEEANNFGTIRCKQCSKIHNQKAFTKRDKKRYNRILKNGSVDWSVNLKELYERDKGVCYLCDKECDVEDSYYDENNFFIVGEKYPSIDHVVAVANGGQHNWNNVRLAHMRCNSLKSTKTIEEILT